MKPPIKFAFSENDVSFLSGCVKAMRRQHKFRLKYVQGRPDLVEAHEASIRACDDWLGTFRLAIENRDAEEENSRQRAAPA